MLLRGAAWNSQPGLRGAKVSFNHLSAFLMLGCSRRWRESSIILTALEACLRYGSLANLFGEQHCPAPPPHCGLVPHFTIQPSHSLLDLPTPTPVRGILPKAALWLSLQSLCCETSPPGGTGLFHDFGPLVDHFLIYRRKEKRYNGIQFLEDEAR